MTRSPEYYESILTRDARILRRLKIVRFYADGDGYSGIFNLYNPLSWFLLLGVICAIFILGGIPAVLESREDTRFYTKVGRYFINNPDKIEWID